MPVDPSQLTRSQRAKYFGSNLVIRGLLGVVLALPYRLRVPFMGWVVARIAGPLAGFPNRIRGNLALTCPDMPDAEVARLCRAVPNNAGRTLIEIYSRDRFSHYANAHPPQGPGLEALHAAQAAGRPVFLVSGHFGNYDAVRANLKTRGIETGALYRRMANPFFNSHYVRSMQTNGALLFEQGRAGMRDLIKHLKSGGIVAILHDLHVHGGEELTFFGQPAVTSIATAELALKFNAEIIPCYAVRQSDGLSFQIEMHAPVPHTDPVTMSQALNDDLEGVIRSHMDQWFWIHRRWKPWMDRGRTDLNAG